MLKDAGAGKDGDVVLTTREISRMIRPEYINLEMLEEEEFDTCLKAWVLELLLFGATGGVMKAKPKISLLFSE